MERDRFYELKDLAKYTEKSIVGLMLNGEVKVAAMLNYSSECKMFLYLLERDGVVFNVTKWVNMKPIKKRFKTANSIYKFCNS